MEPAAYVITVQPGHTDQVSAELFKQAKEYERSPLAKLAIDLSRLSILQSKPLGSIAKLIKVAQTKRGAVVLLVTNDSLNDVLRMVHFNTVATIVRDAEDFKKILSEPLPAPADAIQGSSPAPEKPSSLRAGETSQAFAGGAATRASAVASADKPAVTNKTVFIGLTGALIVLLLMVLGIGYLFLRQSRDATVFQAQSAAAILRLQQQNDSLTNAIRRSNEESTLMNELDQTITKSGRKPQ
jgi:anti-anti-sigma regulatory factor